MTDKKDRWLKIPARDILIRAYLPLQNMSISAIETGRRIREAFAERMTDQMLEAGVKINYAELEKKLAIRYAESEKKFGDGQEAKDPQKTSGD